VTTLCVPWDQSEELRAALREAAESNAALPPDCRLEIAREAVREDFSSAWRSRDPDALVTRAAEFSQTVVDVCRSEEAMTAALASLVVHDADTFAHVSNVCMYSIMLARSLGVEHEDELLQIGQAGLLHDIGKRSIDTSILKKPGRLTPAERAVIANHPRLGFEELCHRPDLTREQLLTVYQHHERIDGSGYPVGFVGEEICWMARLCAVVDVFDALTGRRVYRQAASPQDALTLLRQRAGTDYWPEYVKCWTSLVDQATASR
jgi:HD-GYP domain-containing protein (c-di-GMP phosphodiesterase class II)